MPIGRAAFGRFFRSRASKGLTRRLRNARRDSRRSGGRAARPIGFSRGEPITADRTQRRARDDFDDLLNEVREVTNNRYSRQQAQEKSIDLDGALQILEDSGGDIDSRERRALLQLEAYIGQREFLQDLGLNPDTQTERFVSYGGPGQGVDRVRIDFWLENIDIQFKQSNQTYTYDEYTFSFNAVTAVDYFVQGQGLTRYLNAVRQGTTSVFEATDYRQRLSERRRQLNERQVHTSRNKFARNKSRGSRKEFQRFERETFREAYQRTGDERYKTTLSQKLLKLDRQIAREDDRLAKHLFGFAPTRRTQGRGNRFLNRLRGIR